MADLRSHFPGLFDLERAEENWQKQIARLATDQPYQLMSSAETERELRKKLRLEILDRGVEKSYELMEFPVFLKVRSTPDVMRSLGHDLRELSTRANPIYAPDHLGIRRDHGAPPATENQPEWRADWNGWKIHVRRWPRRCARSMII